MKGGGSPPAPPGSGKQFVTGKIKFYKRKENLGRVLVVSTQTLGSRPPPPPMQNKWGTTMVHHQSPIAQPQCTGGAPDVARVRRGDLAVRPDQAAVDSLVARPEEPLFFSAIWTRVGKINNPAGRPQTRVVVVRKDHLVYFHLGRRRIRQDGGIFTQVLYPRVCSP